MDLAEPPSRHRAVRIATRTASAGIVALLGFLAVMLTATPARAEDPPPTLAEAQRQVEELSQQMTVTNEELNRIRDQLDQSRQRQTDLQAQLDDAQNVVGDLEGEVGEMGQVAYEAGPLLPLASVLASDSPTTLIEQLAYLDVLSSQQRSSLDDLGTARDDLSDAKELVDAEVANYEDKERELNSTRDRLQADLDKWEKLRNELSPPVSRDQQHPSYNGQASGNAEAAVMFAYDQLGKPYEFGSAGPDSFDCSGLTQAAWSVAGVSLPHSSSEQYRQVGNKVAQENLAPGDLIIFYSDMHHVGIYIGSGQVIHSPQPGDNVKVANVGDMPYYGAVRP